MKIYSVLNTGHAGLQTEIYTNRKAADEAAARFVRQFIPDLDIKVTPQNWQQVWEDYTAKYSEIFGNPDVTVSEDTISLGPQDPGLHAYLSCLDESSDAYTLEIDGQQFDVDFHSPTLIEGRAVEAHRPKTFINPAACGVIKVIAL